MRFHTGAPPARIRARTLPPRMPLLRPERAALVPFSASWMAVYRERARLMRLTAYGLAAEASLTEVAREFDAPFGKNLDDQLT